MPALRGPPAVSAAHVSESSTAADISFLRPFPQIENLLNIPTLGYPHQTSMILDKRVPPQTSMLSIKVPFINLLEVKPPQTH